jgi:hypothetical protein
VLLVRKDLRETLAILVLRVRRDLKAILEILDQQDQLALRDHRASKEKLVQQVQ